VSSVPFHRALKKRKSKTVKGKPPTAATTPAATECHLMQPNAKSTTAQIEKKLVQWDASFTPALCSTLHNAEHTQQNQVLSQARGPEYMAIYQH